MKNLLWWWWSLWVILERGRKKKKWHFSMKRMLISHLSKVIVLRLIICMFWYMNCLMLPFVYIISPFQCFWRWYNEQMEVASHGSCQCVNILFVGLLKWQISTCLGIKRGIDGWLSWVGDTVDPVTYKYRNAVLHCVVRIDWPNHTQYVDDPVTYAC